MTRQIEGGLYAEPVIVGPHHRPAAVIIGGDLFNAPADEIDAIQSAPAIRQRLEATAAAGGPVASTLRDVANQVGVDLND